MDATGRDAFSLSRNGWKVRDPYLNKIAIWTYYKDAFRDPGIDEGATTAPTFRKRDGSGISRWQVMWLASVSSPKKDYLYKDTRDLAEIFHREVGNNVWIDGISEGEQFGPVQSYWRISYRSRHCAANGLVLIGDAFAFLDPVFSSGVFLALRSGELAADVVDAALKEGDYSAERFAGYGEQICYGIESMRRLVYTFYHHGVQFSRIHQQISAVCRRPHGLSYGPRV